MVKDEDVVDDEVDQENEEQEEEDETEPEQDGESFARHCAHIISFPDDPHRNLLSHHHESSTTKSSAQRPYANLYTLRNRRRSTRDAHAHPIRRSRFSPASLTWLSHRERERERE